MLSFCRVVAQCGDPCCRLQQGCRSSCFPYSVVGTSAPCGLGWFAKCSTGSRNLWCRWACWCRWVDRMVWLPAWGQPRIGPEATERSLWVPTGRPTFRGLEFQRVGNPERVKVSAETPSGFFACCRPGAASRCADRWLSRDGRGSSPMGRHFHRVPESPVVWLPQPPVGGRCFRTQLQPSRLRYTRILASWMMQLCAT